MCEENGPNFTHGGDVSDLLPVSEVDRRTLDDLRRLPFEYDVVEDARRMSCGCDWSIAHQTIRLCRYHRGDAA